jgi:hypothetical protein
MNRMIAPLIACALLGACEMARVDASKLPPSFYGPTVFVDDAAAYEAKWVFGGNSSFPTDAAKSAHIVAVIEYLGGAVNSNGQWSDLAGVVQVQMLQGRAEIRAALGVAPTARSQEIVDALVVVSRTNDPKQQMAALDSPIFTRGPEATLRSLADMPPLPVTTRAVQAFGNAQNRLSTAY